jgi:acyl-CoA synthetase (AMP-forming)/AMP-acid ligase II
MNKGLLSFLVLFFTTLIMGAMTYFINLNYEEAKLKAESVKNQKNEILNINEEENGQKAIENNKKELKEDREKENISENNNKQSNDLDKSQLKEEKEIEIEGKSKENATNIKKNEKSKEKVAEEKSSKESKEVFKVDKYSIPKKIKLMSIAKNLSLTDYGVLLEHIKRNDELDAAIDIFKILKDKLEEKEYKEMKDILSPYINIELIEEKI